MSIVAGVVSNCLPPWLEMMIPSTPYLMAFSTSSLEVTTARTWFCQYVEQSTWLRVDVFLHSGTDLLSPRVLGLSDFESKECIPPKFQRHLKSVHEKAVSKNCTNVTWHILTEISLGFTCCATTLGKVAPGGIILQLLRSSARRRPYMGASTVKITALYQVL